MAYDIHMLETPTELPEGFEPPHPEDLGYYRLNYQGCQLLIDVMVACGALVEVPPTPETLLSSPAHTGAFLRQDGTVVSAGQCATIARALRPIITEGIPSNAMEDLAARWNERADEQKADAEARGEIAIAGFEHFTATEPQIRGFVVHWGFFNAIAAEHSGYRVT